MTANSLNSISIRVVESAARDLAKVHARAWRAAGQPDAHAQAVNSMYRMFGTGLYAKERVAFLHSYTQTLYRSVPLKIQRG
jgi:hypothetical protein